MKHFQYKTVYFSFCFLLSSLLLYSCGGSTDKKEVKTEVAANEKEGQEEHTDVVEISEQQLKAVGITIGNLEQKNLNAVVKASGQLAAPPQNQADVNVLMGGIVRKITVLEGQSIEKGKPVVWLENQEFVKMQQEYLTTRNAFAFTQEELKRQQELNQAEAGTGKVLQQAQANYNAEKAKLLGLEKQLQQLGINPVAVVNGTLVTQIPVVAPISGTIGHISINTGTFAEPGKPLMEIIDNSEIHCDLIVFEKDLFKVKTGQKVNFILTNQNNQQIHGEIYGINKSFEDASKGIIVHAIIRDAARYRLIPGMYVTALIDVGNQLTTAVPVDALVRSEGKDFIYMLAGLEEKSAEQPKEEGEEKKDEVGKHYQFKKVEVVTGVTELGYTQITPLEELPEKAQIITKGAFYVLSKSRGGEEEEH
ncbi:efflux RND transporter periplasmic adaptor subunit [Chitinophaga japonensis]|uniref:Cobalt-zinc-cadmium efflux system membrane fusion protein n=1 Tax=Chitinophaga japonensis TaxID=104662 RepID=A0A562SMW5_CHIJA|nr:efflux RND transporter periplasmic adaptor subunit [Chitinophaga japonensis]TWI82629.1 cobalt-zinc-cadmium efflux system membrane fusion protein [Chitinophaga japonensis]